MATATQVRGGQIRQAEVLSLAREGHSNVAIGEKLGCSEALVRYHFKAWVASKEPPAERAVELREQWYDRIEFAHAKNWPGVEAGDPEAIAVLLKLETAAAKLMGLDMPTRVDVSLNLPSAESLAELFADGAIDVEAREIEAGGEADA